MIGKPDSNLELKKKALHYAINTRPLQDALEKAKLLMQEDDVYCAMNNFIEITGESRFLDIFLSEHSYSSIKERGGNDYFCDYNSEVYKYERVCSRGDPLLIYYNGLYQNTDFFFKEMHLSSGQQDKSFRNLADIMQERFDLDDEIKGTVTWILLVQAAFKRYYTRWVSEYDTNPEGINQIDAYSRYCYNNSIVFPGDKKASAILTYYLCCLEEPGIKNTRSLIIGQEVLQSIASAENDAKKLGMEKLLFSHQQRQAASHPISMNDVDIMSGIEFERFVAKLFSTNGFAVDMTPASGDQGVDIIATKGVQRIGIQAKRYSGNIGNAAIQEVVGGQKYYGLTKLIVVTNRFFTNAAYKLAEKNEVVLWDRGVLKDKIDEYNAKL